MPLAARLGMSLGENAAVAFVADLGGGSAPGVSMVLGEHAGRVLAFACAGGAGGEGERDDD